MLLNVCPVCTAYTLKEKCSICKKPTKSAHYKFKGLKDAPRDEHASSTK